MPIVTNAITLSVVSDGAKGDTGATGANGKGVKSNTRYYCLQTSATKPSKPTTNPPDSKWTTTEPSYTTGSTSYLYTVDLTVYTDSSFLYSDVSLSSSYEAAKAAYAKAVNAETEIEKTNEQVALRATKNEVTETLKGYATTASMNAAITTKANEITSSVAANYSKQLWHTAYGTSGVKGYIGFAELTITGDWSNRPILFCLTNRGAVESNISLRFENISGSDPGLSWIRETGGINIWIVKTATSKWTVIAKKSEDYDAIYVNDFTNTNSNISVAWVDVHYDAIPDGAVESTKLVGSQAISTIATKSEVTQTADNIRSDVSKTLGNYSTTTQMNSAIDQRANSITQTVSETYTTKTDFNSLTTRVEQTEEAWSVTSAKLDGMYAGGQNLLEKRNFALNSWCTTTPRGTWYTWPTWAQAIFSSDYGFYSAASSSSNVAIGSVIGVKLLAYKDYTLSFKAFCSSPSGNYTETQGIYARIFKTTDYGERVEKYITISAGASRYSYTFNTGSTSFDGGLDFLAWVSDGGVALNYGVYIGDIMLVEGNVPSAWSPNEWDGAKTTTVTVDHTGMYVDTQGIVKFNTNKFEVNPPDGADQLFSVNASDRTMRAQNGYFDNYLYSPNMATHATSRYISINVGGSGNVPNIQSAWDSLPDVCGEVRFRICGNSPGYAELKGKHISFLIIESSDTSQMYDVGTVWMWGVHGRASYVTISKNGTSSDDACRMYCSMFNFENVKFASAGRGLLLFNGSYAFLRWCSITGVGSVSKMAGHGLELYSSSVNMYDCSGVAGGNGIYLASGSFAALKGNTFGPTHNTGGGVVVGSYTIDGTTYDAPTVSTSSTFSASTCATWQSTYGSTWKKLTDSVGKKVESRHSTTSSGFDYRAGWWVLDTGTAIKTALSGKTISKATVTIKRNDTNSDTRKCHLCYHNKTNTKMNTSSGPTDGTASGVGNLLTYGEMTEIGSYNLNPSAETVITLPSSVYSKLQDGTIKGFGLVDNATDYKQIMCDNTCTLTVVYT